MIVYALKADRRIIDQKKNGEELDIEPRNEALNSFIEERIRYFSNEVKNVKSIAFPDSSKLNEIFRNAIYH
ncbi:hypothetical protein A2767_01125 [Candidatus Roizmanbacteria bacterium RIFCSPHIGHO2_01_FULL_35_10]|uniref:Uncharacterized protein n=1 Tax=Candidatus Roizmanbacteria bacterium RIFCSPLOWO2_01_FULL_35_13 TaxID=1802055 RepID=A0A1F7IC12_9BACT|nr:MAG: hypothetical protein A2767_01125 [Candidatus Roizmanbacteria bacterium RIFCSPHIGHO2_01_FULL_35_10]OGK40884.1 MAG: hypothetical protein A3A74_01495 [Candidatus Roizmanbacteria bacterium RIFCSPLOWO2_01_FULL_35_13]